MRIYLVLLVILGACTTPRKAVDVLSRPNNEPVAAEFCATKYPVKDSIIKGDSVIKYDTLWGIVTDTVISDPQVLIYTDTVRVPKLVTKTITVRDTIVRENTAKVAVLNNSNRKLAEINADLSQKLVRISAERYTFKHERNKWKLRFFLLLFGVGLLYAAKVKFTKKLF